MCVWMLQVDYAAAGIFINITTDSEEGHSAPWWRLEGARMAPGLEPLTPVCPCPIIPNAYAQCLLLSQIPEPAMHGMFLNIHETGGSAHPERLQWRGKLVAGTRLSLTGSAAAWTGV